MDDLKNAVFMLLEELRIFQENNSMGWQKVEMTTYDLKEALMVLRNISSTLTAKQVLYYRIKRQMDLAELDRKLAWNAAFRNSKSNPLVMSHASVEERKMAAISVADNAVITVYGDLAAILAALDSAGSILTVFSKEVDGARKDLSSYIQVMYQELKMSSTA